MSWKRIVLVSLGSLMGSAVGAWIGSRLAQGCPVWPW